MTPEEAQDVAFRWANLHSNDITLSEIKQALVVLANYYEDVSFEKKQRGDI